MAPSHPPPLNPVDARPGSTGVPCCIFPICPGTKRVSSSDNNQNSPLGLGHMCGTGGMEGGNSSTKRSRQASGMFTASFSCRASSGYMSWRRYGWPSWLGCSVGEKMTCSSGSTSSTPQQGGGRALGITDSFPCWIERDRLHVGHGSAFDETREQPGASLTAEEAARPSRTQPSSEQLQTWRDNKQPTSQPRYGPR